MQFEHRFEVRARLLGCAELGRADLTELKASGDARRFGVERVEVVFEDLDARLELTVGGQQRAERFDRLSVSGLHLEGRAVRGDRRRAIDRLIVVLRFVLWRRQLRDTREDRNFGCGVLHVHRDRAEPLGQLRRAIVAQVRALDETNGRTKPGHEDQRAVQIVVALDRVLAKREVQLGRADVQRCRLAFVPRLARLFVQHLAGGGPVLLLSGECVQMTQRFVVTEGPRAFETRLRQRVIERHLEQLHAERSIGLTKAARVVVRRRWRTGISEPHPRFGIEDLLGFLVPFARNKDDKRAFEDVESCRVEAMRVTERDDGAVPFVEVLVRHAGERHAQVDLLFFTRQRDRDVE